jgi:hypothetical protein
MPPTPIPNPSRVERARQGDLDSLKALELVPVADRTPEDCAAIAVGHTALTRSAVEKLGRDLGQKPELLQDRNVLAQLFGYASDPLSAEAALPILARIDDALGPDMLYEIWKHDRHPSSRSLAEDLLSTRAVQKRASKELELVLDLEREERCDKVQKLLEKAGEKVDRRVLPRLKVLEAEDGCGEKKQEDCFPCLRSTDLLEKTRAQAEKRKKQPEKWEIRRR